MENVFLKKIEKKQTDKHFMLNFVCLLFILYVDFSELFLLSLIFYILIKLKAAVASMFFVHKF